MIKQAIQDSIIDWIKTQGTWAVLFIALVVWFKPHADSLIDSHVRLVETLKESQMATTKAIQELKELFREAQLMRHAEEERHAQSRKADRNSQSSVVAIPGDGK